MVYREQQRPVSKKTGPNQASNVSRLHQQQCHNGILMNDHYSQSVLSGVNFGKQHCLDAAPSSDGTTGHERRIVAGLSSSNETSDMNNGLSVHHTFPQITSAVSSPYTSAVQQRSTVLDKPSSYGTFSNRTVLSTFLQIHSQQNSNWLSDSSRVSSIQTRHNHHHHHLSNREGTNFEVDSHDLEEPRGMHLPVTIQLEGPNSEKLTLKSDQAISGLQPVSMKLPVSVMSSNCSDLPNEATTQNQTDLCRCKLKPGILEKEATTQAVGR